MVEGGGGPFVYAQYAPALPSSGHHGQARHCFGRGGPLATLGIMQRELQGTWGGRGGSSVGEGTSGQHHLEQGGDLRQKRGQVGRKFAKKEVVGRE